MRSWLLPVFIVAGCLQAQAQAPAPHRPSDDPSKPALAAYARFMRAQDYVNAAEIAWRFGLGEYATGLSMGLQHERASHSIARFLAGQDGKDALGLQSAAERELLDEALIGCRYSSRPHDGPDVIADTLAFRQAAADDSVLFPLLDAGCPVDDQQRDGIIEVAYARGADEFAIRQAVVAAETDWDEGQKSRFVLVFFLGHRCGAGVRAAVALKIPSKDLVEIVESSACESAGISSDGWSLNMDDARAAFFAAARTDKFNLALTLLPFCGFDENGELYLFEEAFRRGVETVLGKVIVFHPGRQDALMRYAYDLGRYRFVGAYAQTLDWQRKGFDKLVELGHYDFAAEVAQYGVDDGFRSQGIVLAFQAAMAAGDFRTGRFLLSRYGLTGSKSGLLTQEMYDKAYQAYFDKKKAARPSRRRELKLPPCPDDDWSVEPCR